jgi:hypothetical protein
MAQTIAKKERAANEITSPLPEADLSKPNPTQKKIAKALASAPFTRDWQEISIDGLKITRKADRLMVAVKFEDKAPIYLQSATSLDSVIEQLQAVRDHKLTKDVFAVIEKVNEKTGKQKKVVATYNIADL